MQMVGLYLTGLGSNLNSSEVLLTNTDNPWDGGHIINHQDEYPFAATETSAKSLKVPPEPVLRHTSKEFLNILPVSTCNRPREGLK